MLRILLVLLFLLPQTPVFAQDQNGQDPSVIEKYGPRRQISTIVYMGLAGAVLGLSTLSFYGRPQDHLTNIPIGFGVGVVIGTIYMTYQAATNPDEFYRESRYEPDWRDKKEVITMATDLYYQPERPSFSYGWTF
ncbi:MAG: hypothetical protein AAF203_07845 [Pseudomonadota bacterium]